MAIAERESATGSRPFDLGFRQQLRGSEKNSDSQTIPSPVIRAMVLENWDLMK